MAKPQHNQLIVDRLFFIERTLEDRGWDQPVSIYLLIRDPGDPFGQRPVVYPFLMKDGPWTYSPRPYLILRALAMGMAPGGGGPLGSLPSFPGSDQVLGVAFANEAWMLVKKGATPAEIAATDRLAARRQIHKHPDRIEIRMVSAYDRGGRLYVVQRKRGALPEAWEGLDDDAEEREPLGGMLTDCLAEFGQAIMQTTW